jgi:hypothetical protein
MSYTGQFQKWHERLKRPRVLVWLHLILNVVAFILMQKLVYEPVFCFSLLHPIDSVIKCGNEIITK